MPHASRPLSRTRHCRRHHHPHRHQAQRQRPPTVAARAPGQQDERQWPQHVPLLFDRQAPQMPEQRRRARPPVRLLGEDLTPVGEVPEAPGVVVTQLRVLLGRPPHGRPCTDHDHHREQRRQQASPTTNPELPQVHPARAVTLLDQQGGDQEPGDDEENLHAEETAVHPREPCVIEDDRDHREGADPIEPGLIPHRGRSTGLAVPRVAVPGVVQRLGHRWSVSQQQPRNTVHRRQRRRVVPALVVSTVQPAACNCARSASAAGKSFAARAASSAAASAAASAGTCSSALKVSPTASAIE